MFAFMLQCPLCLLCACGPISQLQLLVWSEPEPHDYLSTDSTWKRHAVQTLVTECYRLSSLSQWCVHTCSYVFMMCFLWTIPLVPFWGWDVWCVMGSAPACHWAIWTISLPDTTRTAELARPPLLPPKAAAIPDALGKRRLGTFNQRSERRREVPQKAQKTQVHLKRTSLWGLAMAPMRRGFAAQAITKQTSLKFEN